MGMPTGRFGKREPTVSTGSCRKWTISEASRMAIKNPGSRGVYRRKPMINANTPIPTATVIGLKLENELKYACHLATKSAGTDVMDSPRKSLTWLQAIMTAMPAVKPVTTGFGMNLIICPNFK